VVPGEWSQSGRLFHAEVTQGVASSTPYTTQSK